MVNTAKVAFAIDLQGAEENNLKKIDLSIPFGQLVCLTGVSGSGKSTLIQNCLVAVAAHRHQILSRSTRRIPLLYGPMVKHVDVPFIVDIKQGALQGSNRSVVGTSLGLLPRLRQLVAVRADVRDSDGNILLIPNEKNIAEWCKSYYPDATIIIFSCLGRRILGPLWPWIEPVITSTVAPKICVVETGEEPSTTGAHDANKYKRSAYKTHRDIYAVVGETNSSDGQSLESIIKQALQYAYSTGAVTLTIKQGDRTYNLQFDGKLLNPNDVRLYQTPSLHLLSFNSYHVHSGRCRMCDGLGVVKQINTKALIVDLMAPLSCGALAIPFEAKKNDYVNFSGLANEIRGLISAHNLPLNARWQDIPQLVQQEFLEGSSPRVIQPLDLEGKPRGSKKIFEGVVQRIERKLEGSSSAVAVLQSLKISQDCPECLGSRLNYAAQSVHFGGKFYSDILCATLMESRDWLNNLIKHEPNDEHLAILKHLAHLCATCVNLGLGHLSLNRSTSTLSGGEAQRLKISRDLGAKLQNACYILDEPTRGLHIFDTGQLVSTFKQLVDSQTSVLLVEHNPVIIDEADRVVELGQSGGVNGGYVIYDGVPSGSPLMKYVPPILLNTPSTAKGWIEVRQASLRNIRNQSFKLPLGQMICFTGLSGSGKTTLVKEILYPALELWVATGELSGSGHCELLVEGIDTIDLIYVGQNTINNNPRSRISTFLNVSNDLRDWFFKASNAGKAGLTLAHFSPNSALGQCPVCKGLGVLEENEVFEKINCPSCNGSTLSQDVLFPTVDGHNFAWWSALSLDQICLIECLPKRVKKAAHLACDLGLSHLTLSRSLPTLSGGEAQRVKVAKALIEAEDRDQKKNNPHLFFIMDEPSSGLHPKDTHQLIQALRRVVDGGKNTLVLVEHNISVIKGSDWIVDIGPKGGTEGGQVLFSGSVDDLVESSVDNSLTRLALLGNRPQPIKNEISHNDLACDGTLKKIQAHDGIRTFKAYLAHAETQIDTEDSLVTTQPSYAISEGGTSTYVDFDVLSLLGLARPLFELYAAESSMPGMTIYHDECFLREEALKLLNEGYLAGWFPLAHQATMEKISNADVVVAIKDYLSSGGFGWYDGYDIQFKPPVGSKALPIEKVRLMLDPILTPEQTIQSLLSLGQGWFSVFEPSSKIFKELSLRAIDLSNRRVGERWQLPQIFDPRICKMACSLCFGTGHVETVNESLILANQHKTILDDGLFTLHALEVLRARRRKDMIPVINRLFDSNLINLKNSIHEMSEEERIALWFGYPEKSYLKTNGRQDVKGDWYCWKGLVNVIIEQMWKSSDRAWANAVNQSRKHIQCPHCMGTGFGWEASQRIISNISLKNLTLNYNVETLGRWVSDLQPTSLQGKECKAHIVKHIGWLIENELAEIKLSSKYIDLSREDKIICLSMLFVLNPLVGAMIYPQVDTEYATINRFFKQIQQSSVMQWMPASEGKK